MSPWRSRVAGRKAKNRKHTHGELPQLQTPSRATSEKSNAGVPNPDTSKPKHSHTSTGLPRALRHESAAVSLASRRALLAAARRGPPLERALHWAPGRPESARARAQTGGRRPPGRSQGQAHAVPHVAQHRLRRAEQLQQLLVGARLRRRQLPRLHLRAAACRVSAGPPRGRAGARRGPAGSTRAPAGCAPGRGSMPYQACATC